MKIHQNVAFSVFRLVWRRRFWQGQISGSVGQFPARFGAFVDPLEDCIVGKFHENLTIKSWDRSLWKSSPWLDSAWNWWSKLSVFGQKIDKICDYFVLDAFVWLGKRMQWLLWSFQSFCGDFIRFNTVFRPYFTWKSIKMRLSLFLGLIFLTGTNLRINERYPRQVWSFCWLIRVL